MCSDWFFYLIFYFQKGKGHVYLIIGALETKVLFYWRIVYLAWSVRFKIHVVGIPFLLYHWGHHPIIHLIAWFFVSTYGWSGLSFISRKSCSRFWNWSTWRLWCWRWGCVWLWLVFPGSGVWLLWVVINPRQEYIGVFRGIWIHCINHCFLNSRLLKIQYSSMVYFEAYLDARKFNHMIELTPLISPFICSNF